MRFVGIDPSLSRTGFCALSDGVTVIRHKVTSVKNPVLDRQVEVVTAAREFVQKGDIVLLEDFGIAARFALSGRFVERIEICGMLKLVLPAICAVPLLVVPPTMLKSFVVGNGRADKEAMVKAVESKWGICVSCDDEADAFGLAALGRAFFNGEKIKTSVLSKFAVYGSNRRAINKIKFLGII
ncbi:MAG: hypothetical protein LBQ51_02330 [Desulfovibrio sp.]|jgi:Holliday junction resolvasome RuvABC endonuclease subunit|nr:hypothetical protein [Desulfovibrio sp.]